MQKLGRLRKIVRRVAQTGAEWRKVRRVSADRCVVFAFRFNLWKRDFIAAAYPQFEFVFVPFKQTPIAWHPAIRAARRCAFLCWGNNESPSVRAYARLAGIPLWRMEDGFIRSMGLGANHTLPMSLVLDRSGHLYFDARGQSDLERLLVNYDFDANPDLLDRAKYCMDRLREHRVSKYNLAGARTGREIYDQWGEPKSDAKRILVVGQVESDASILYGSPPGTNNARVVWEARRRNPNAQIFFKPHPDVLHGKRAAISALDEIRNFAHVIDAPLAMHAAFDTVDEVYTATSLAGFEALLYGKKVVTVGTPFYAGWGLTHDLNPVARRARKLSVEQVFAAAYLLYPDYFNPVTGQPIQPEDAIDLVEMGLRLREEREQLESPAAAGLDSNGAAALVGTRAMHAQGEA